MKINLDRVFDYLMDADNEAETYYWYTSQYKKRHGYVCCLRNEKLSLEKENIREAYIRYERAKEAAEGIIYVLSLDREQSVRLYAAERAVKRWYNRETKWQRCLPEELLDRLYRFIEG